MDPGNAREIVKRVTVLASEPATRGLPAVLALSLYQFLDENVHEDDRLAAYMLLLDECGELGTTIATGVKSVPRWGDEDCAATLEILRQNNVSLPFTLNSPAELRRLARGFCRSFEALLEDERRFSNFERLLAPRN